MPTEARTSDQRGLVLITPEAFADMDHWHSTIGELRREAPVAWVEADGWPSFWAVTSHEGVFEVSRRSDVFFNTERSAPGPDFNYDMMAAMGIATSPMIGSSLPLFVGCRNPLTPLLTSTSIDWSNSAELATLPPTLLFRSPSE